MIPTTTTTTTAPALRPPAEPAGRRAAATASGLPEPNARLRFGRFELRRQERRVLADGLAVPLGSRAFDLLVALVDRRAGVVTKDELLDAVWPGLVVEEANVQVQVSALRKVLGHDAVATIPGRGYQFAMALDADLPAAARVREARSQGPAARGPRPRSGGSAHPAGVFERFRTLKDAPRAG